MKAVSFAVALTCVFSCCNNVEATIRSPSASPKVDPALEKLCLGTEFPAECMKTEAQCLNGGAAVDARSVLISGLKLLSDRTAKAISECEQIKKNQPSGPLAGAIDVCISYYHNVPNSAKNASDALSKGFDSMLELELDDAFISVFHCDDMFQDSQDKPLFYINLQLHMAAKNNIDIANLMGTRD